MATQRYFGTCNGQPVRLSNAYNREIGRTPEGKIIAAIAGECSCGSLHAVERTINRKDNPSNHKCGDKCRNAKGFSCECSCGGKFHGHGNRA